MVPLQLFGDHTGNQTQADIWAKKSLLLWGSLPAPQAAVPAHRGNQAVIEQQPPRALLPWKGPTSTWAVHFAFQKTRGFMNRKLHFLAYSPAAECHVQKSQANAVAVSWLRNYPARSGLSILRTFKFAACVGLKRECRARSPGGRLRTAIPIQLQTWENPNISLSFLPASRWEQEQGVLPSASQSETKESG